MKPLLLSILVLLLCCRSFAQYYEIGIDEKYAAQLMVDLAERTAADGEYNNNLSKIQTSKVNTNTYLTSITAIQNELYNSLTTVNGIIANGKSIPYLATLATSIYNFQAKLVNEAGKYPLYLPFAQKYESAVAVKTANLLTYIYNFIEANDQANIMDNGKRNALFHHVLTELSVINGLSYTAYLSVKTAASLGLLKAYNPWRNYINMDQQYAQQALRQFNAFKK